VLERVGGYRGLAGVEESGGSSVYCLLLASRATIAAAKLLHRSAGMTGRRLCSVRNLADSTLSSVRYSRRSRKKRRRILAVGGSLSGELLLMAEEARRSGFFRSLFSSVHDAGTIGLAMVPGLS
jgi:hypothetical protein